jgi:dienelactone hydrolase
MRPRPFQLKGADGAAITGDLYIPAPDVPLVIVIHGFKGFKDWGCFPWIGQQLASAGLAAAVINLSHNGIGSKFDTFERLDLFEADTWSKRVFDLEQVLHAASHGLLGSGDQPHPARIGLLGHSMGGGLAVLMAARDPRVRSIVTLAGVSRPNRIPMAEVKAHLQAYGHVQVENARTRQIMRIGREFFDELEAHGGAFDIQAAARASTTPWLIVHGAADEAVPLDEAHELLDAANGNPVEGENVKLLVIENAGHTFGAAHPFKSPAPELEQAIDCAARHFLRTL